MAILSRVLRLARGLNREVLLVIGVVLALVIIQTPSAQIHRALTDTQAVTWVVVLVVLALIAFGTHSASARRWLARSNYSRGGN